MKSFFISSTFKDMQSERDIIHQIVFPKLRKKLADYGEDIQELDLRWGVDTTKMSEEESGKHVVSTCIDAIDRSTPYFIVLLGERYGWIPESNLIENIDDERITEIYEARTSITQLEIMYGALSQEDMKHCIFCFREPEFNDMIPDHNKRIYDAESDEHRRKLNALKEKIRSREDANIITYSPSWNNELNKPTGLESFAESLESSLWQIVEKDLEEMKSDKPYQKVLNDAVLTGRRYLSSYVSRQKMSDAGAHALIGGSHYWIHGPQGSGKSAYMASLAERAIQMGYRTFLYYSSNEGCNRLDTLVRTLSDWLVETLAEGRDPKIYTANRVVSHRFDNAFYKQSFIKFQLDAVRRVKLAILIDDIDALDEEAYCFILQLSEYLNLTENLVEVQKKHPYALVLSCSDAFYNKHKEYIVSHPMTATLNRDEMQPFTNGEIYSLIQMHAYRRGKHID